MILRIRSYLNKINRANQFVIFFAIFFIAEFVSSLISPVFFDSFIRIPAFFKLVFEGFLVLLIIKNLSRVDMESLDLLLLLIYAFLAGNLIFIPNYNLTIFYQNLYYFDKYLYIFLFVIAFSVIDFKKDIVKNIINLFLKFMFFNSIVILIGLIFTVETLRSYPGTERFGFRGMFSVAGLALHNYVLIIVLLYENYLTNQRKKDILLLIFFVVISLLIGKKTIVLFLGLLAIYHFFFKSKNKIIWQKVALIMLFIVIPFFKRILNYFLYWFHGDLINDRHSLIYLITSSRSTLLVNTVSSIRNKWGIFNFLFGGIEYSRFKVEFELVDVFLFFGFVGFIIFILFFWKIFFVLAKRNARIYLIMIALTSFFTGGFLLDVVFMMLLFLVIWKMHSKSIEIY